MIRHFLLSRKRCVALCVALCTLLCLAGCTACGASEARYFAYRDAPLSASVSGCVNGVEIRAELACDGTSRTVRYVSPASLAGLCVHTDGSGAARVTQGDLAYSTDAETAAGLLLPLSLLLDLPGAVRSVKRAEGLTVLSLEGAALTLDKSLRPVRISSPHATLSYEWHG